MKKKNNALDESNPHICIGWSALGDLSNMKNKKQLNALYDEKLPDSKPKSKASNVGQLNRFVNETNKGDKIVYREGKGVHIGEITSDYIFTNLDFGDDQDYKNIRKVKWLKHVSTDVFLENFLNSLDSAMSYFSMNEYSELIDSVLDDSYWNNFKAFKDLKAAEDIDSSTYDASYLFVTKLVEAYDDVSIDDLDKGDLENIYFATILSTEVTVENKKKKINSSHLNDDKKKELVELLEELEKKTKSGDYSHKENDEFVMGMFGTGMRTLNVSAENARLLISLFKKLRKEQDFATCISELKEATKNKIKGAQTGVVSTILHCLQPTIYPIINGHTADSKIFEKLGIPIEHPRELDTYAENIKKIHEFRDRHFTFKNYRVFDIESFKIQKSDSSKAESTANADPKNFEKAEPKKAEPFSINDFLNDVFISKEEYEEIHELLERKKNIILQGAPGVGKTFMAKRIAYAFMGEKDDKRIEMVQFHQSYSYEDFVFGYQPDGNEFKLTPGIFYSFCKKASENPDKPYFFIIDEINRGNLSKIFGELLMLIENDKRGTSSLTLSHTKEPFTIPKNLYIIGMMNTADRSLAIVDYALRRRFSFIKVKPAFETSSFRDYLKNNDTSDEMIEKIITRFSDLNNTISNDSSLGDGFAIGHSYFCDGNNPITDGIYKTIIKYDIVPILDEYWFDDPEKAKQFVDNLLK